MQTFTVKELIKRLENIRPDLPVVLCDLSNDDEEGGGTHDNFSVEVNQGVKNNTRRSVPIVTICFNEMA